MHRDVSNVSCEQVADPFPHGTTKITPLRVMKAI